MGFFDSTQETTEKRDIPSWMEGMPQELVQQVMGYLNQDMISPSDQVAALNPEQMLGINQMVGYGAQGPGGDIFNALYGAGGQGIGMFGQGQESMMDVFNQGQITPELNMQNVTDYVDSDLVSSQITSALRDPQRQLMEQALPGSRMAAAASGNTGSSRARMGSDILTRGYLDRAADTSANIRGDAYNTAFGIEAQRAGQEAQLGGQFQGLQGQLAGAMTQSGFQGANLLNMANATGMQNINMLMQGGGMMQAQDQALNDAAMGNYMQGWNNLGMTSDILSQQGELYGPTTTETTSSMSPAQFLLGAGSAVMGADWGGIADIFGGWGNIEGGYEGGGDIFDQDIDWGSGSRIWPPRNNSRDAGGG